MRRAVLVAACLVVAASAQADDKAQAKQLYEEGLRHYNAGEYPAAIVLWKEAYRLSSKPLLLFNIGQAYRLSGDCVQAMPYFDQYAHEETKHKAQEDLDQAIAACKTAVPAPVPVPVPVPVSVPAPGQVATTTPPPTPEPAPPPPARAPAPMQAPIALPLVTDISSPARPQSHRLRDAGLVVGSVGVIAGATGLFFAIRSAHDSSELDNFTGMWGTQQQSTQTEGQAASTRAWIFGIGGAALVATGVTMFVLGRSGGDSGVAIAPTRGGATFAWGTAF